MPGVAALVLGRPKCTAGAGAHNGIKGLQRCPLWITLQWSMDPSQANYCPSLPRGSRENCLIFQALFQTQLVQGLGDLEVINV